MSAVAVFQGFFIGAGMIIPIGAQNAYVLSQGIKQNSHFIAATICILCDLLLMSAGIFGSSALFAENEVLVQVITLGGIAFLLIYGGSFFKKALITRDKVNNIVPPLHSRKTVVLTTLAVTLLNPHVYLDTLVIIGSIGNQFIGADKWAFLSGTILASVTWFYTLSFAAAKMAPWLSQQHVQRWIDLIVALIMWSIALSLIISI
ncbi:LysE/ArgO family amino acid transporter [Colwellia sp. KU-HH00111]|uniref:LysE/ArgO family amino acid transporter n=1 Tax=Colwellia sp. KU-HH00111 TaxID=3127652 RepID=UPI003108E7EA